MAVFRWWISFESGTIEVAEMYGPLAMSYCGSLGIISVTPFAGAVYRIASVPEHWFGPGQSLTATHVIDWLGSQDDGKR